jgi:hypothetical protein
MNNRTQILIVGIFLSTVVGISGYFYLNPKFVKIGDIDGRAYGNMDYTLFKYSILISAVVGILLLTFIKFFSKRK